MTFSNKCKKIFLTHLGLVRQYNSPKPHCSPSIIIQGNLHLSKHPRERFYRFFKFLRFPQKGFLGFLVWGVDCVLTYTISVFLDGFLSFSEVIKKAIYKKKHPVDLYLPVC